MSVGQDGQEEDSKQAEKKAPVDLLRSRTGGAYIPPAKLKLMQDQIADKSGEQYQRINWERLKKKIHRQVNIVNTANLVPVVRELLQENIIRGKGLLARSIIQAQAFSPAYSNVYAALVAVINSKFPHIGELILRRLIVQFKRSFRRNDKATTITITKFLAHLINQQVLHEVLALELMILMLENPTEDSVEVTVAFLKECGAKLTELSPRGTNSIFDRLRSILMDADIDKRVQYMIEVIYTVRRDNFRGFPSVIDELDLIDEEDQITHTLSLEDSMNPENELNVFKFDPEFEKNETMYDEIRKELIGDPGETSSDESNDEGEEQSEEDAEKEQKETLTIIDSTEQNLVAFRRNVYLTIQSSLDFQEAAHKLLKIDLKPGQDVELCNMIVDCCAQQRTYENFYGLLAERFCRLRKEFQDAFERIARDTYNTIHRFEITKLRNMARLIAHLLSSNAISWNVLEEISLNEDDTTSAGRIYIKILFQEIAEFEGVEKLMERIRDPTMQNAFDKIFPRDNPNHTRFSINFFTSIGLGYLTMDLRNHLKQRTQKALDTMSDSPSSSTDSESSSSSSSSDSDSDSSDSSEVSSDGKRKMAESSKMSRENGSDSQTKKIHERDSKSEQKKRQKETIEETEDRFRRVRRNSSGERTSKKNGVLKDHTGKGEVREDGRSKKERKRSWNDSVNDNYRSKNKRESSAEYSYHRHSPEKNLKRACEKTSREKHEYRKDRGRSSEKSHNYKKDSAGKVAYDREVSLTTKEKTRSLEESSRHERMPRKDREYSSKNDRHEKSPSKGSSYEVDEIRKRRKASSRNGSDDEHKRRRERRK